MNKRNLFPMILAACTVGLVSCDSKTTSTQQTAVPSASSEIYVESEFAPLRTVILAQSEIAFSKRMLESDDSRFLPEENLKLAQPGKDFREVDPEGQKAWEREREAFKEVLERHGVKVLRPRMLTQIEKDLAKEDGYSNFFARDPFFTIGNFVIEGSLRFLHRRREVLPIRSVFKEHVLPVPSTYVAMPMPEVADPNDPTLGEGPFLEGGDVLVLGKHVFVGSSGLASNEAGAKWLAKLLEPAGYTVELVRLHPNILHLDCALGLVRDGLMIVCKEAFLDGVPSILSKWDSIPVTMEQATLLATNGLPISPEVYVMDPEFKQIGDEIEKRGVKVEYVDFKITRMFGGSFRCSTQPLLRR